MTGLAFQYFSAQQVEVALVEVGLGGRLDATNLLQPRLAIITNISFDHMEYLGKSLAAIAGEKGGILKPGVPVVLGRMPQIALKVLEEMSEEKGCPVFRIDDLCRVARLRMNAEYSEFDLQTPMRRYERLRVMLPGPHQVANAMVAVLAAEQLAGLPVPLGEEAVRRGLIEVRWPGRFDRASEDPLILIDVAHNPDGMRRLSWMLRHFYPGREIVLVVGFLQDKDYREMIRWLPREVAAAIAVPPVPGLWLRTSWQDGCRRVTTGCRSAIRLPMDWLRPGALSAGTKLSASRVLIMWSARRSG